MKILTPVKELPARTNQRWGKYKEIWNAVLALPNGDWLPVKCDTLKDAKNLYFSAHTHRTLTLQAKQNGVTVYIKRKDSVNVPERETETQQVGVKEFFAA